MYLHSFLHPRFLLLCSLLIPHASAGLFNGPAYPAPTSLASSQAFQQATQAFNVALDAAIASGLPKYGGDTLGTGYALNTTSFSVTIFSPAQDLPLFERQYTDPLTRNATHGVRAVDGNTVFRIGSISKLFTVYLLLVLNGGDGRLNDPVTDWIPELKNATPQPGEVPVVPLWSQITLGDLGSQLAGIARDCKSSIAQVCVASQPHTLL